MPNKIFRNRLKNEIAYAVGEAKNAAELNRTRAYFFSR